MKKSLSSDFQASLKGEAKTQNIKTSDDFVLKGNSALYSKHLVLELYECDASKLDDELYVRNAISNAAKISGATILNLMSHQFQPYGVTGLVLLSESHISIHTWPERRYAAVDVFTCGLKMLPEHACEFLCKEFGAKNSSIQKISRKIPQKLFN